MEARSQVVFAGLPREGQQSRCPTQVDCESRRSTVPCQATCPITHCIFAQFLLLTP